LRPSGSCCWITAKRLVLDHISERYPDEEILAETSVIFPNSLVAADLDVVTV
jgi:ribonuclease Z